MYKSPYLVKKAVCIAPHEICVIWATTDGARETLLGTLVDLYSPVPNAPYYPSPHEYIYALSRRTHIWENPAYILMTLALRLTCTGC